MSQEPRSDDLRHEPGPAGANANHEFTGRDGDGDSGAAGTVARYPLWLIIGAVVVFALVALYLAFMAVPAGP
jgi:hypothetical protein